MARELDNKLNQYVLGNIGAVLSELTTVHIINNNLVQTLHKMGCIS